MHIDILKMVLLITMTFLSAFSGLVPLQIYKRLQRTGKIPCTGRMSRSFVMSLISCFAGGVFLGVCLLDMLPEAFEQLGDLKKVSPLKSDYPFVCLLVGCGFILVYLLEEITAKCFGEAHSHGDDLPQIQITIPRPQSGISLDFKEEKQNEAEVKSESQSSISDDQKNYHEGLVTRSLSFVIALTTHCALEGFAFGVQDDFVSVSSLFFGIMVHKCVVFFSVGVRLIRTHPHRPCMVSVLIIFLSITAPIGGIFGIVLEESPFHPVLKHTILLILTCLSIGTFLYICFFEILGPERAKRHSNMSQLVATATGFLFMAVMMTFST